MKIFCIFALILFFPAAVLARADLMIEQGDIRFSQNPLVAGDQVRIYATVHNIGDEDVSGFVTFYQGATLLGDSLVISLLANGNPEEVYVDFIVPSSSFNIQAQIKGTDPQDEDETNNVAISSMMQPINDDDRDGKENNVDNCSSVANVNQIDSDQDGVGDACDSDDDNDGLSDAVEEEMHTNTTVTDTDADGVADADDAFPADATKQSQPAPQTEVIAPEQSVTLEKIITQVAKSIQETTSESPQSQPLDSQEIQPEQDETREDAQIILSANAVFSYERRAWNSFVFTTLQSQEDSKRYLWNFGDESTSSKTSISHTYKKPGAYTVTLTVETHEGKQVTESAVVLVPFFSLHNPIILIAVAFLSLLLVVVLALLRRK